MMQVFLISQVRKVEVHLVTQVYGTMETVLFKQLHLVVGVILFHIVATGGAM